MNGFDGTEGRLMASSDNGRTWHASRGRQPFPAFGDVKTPRSVETTTWSLSAGSMASAKTAAGGVRSSSLHHYYGA